MHWSGEEIHVFLKEYLGPTFESEGITDTVGIFLSTFPVNDYEGYVGKYRINVCAIRLPAASISPAPNMNLAPTLDDPQAVKYLQGVGLQYAGVEMIGKIKAKAPHLKTW